MIGTAFAHVLGINPFCLLTAALRAAAASALKAAGFNPDELWRLLEMLGGQLQQFAENAPSIARNFLQGANDGFGRLLTNLASTGRCGGSNTGTTARGTCRS